MPPTTPSSNPTLSLTPSILLLNLPPGILCGIDLLTFTTSARFRGIKDLPPGWHFIFTSETASLSIREGFWFEIPKITASSASTSRRAATPPLLIRIWDPNLSILTPCPETSPSYATYRAQLPSLWHQHVTPYRQSPHETSPPSASGGDWALLTAHIAPRLLSHLTGSEDEWRISSASCAVQDRDEIPGLSNEEVIGGAAGKGEGGGGEMLGEERTLGVLGIDLKRTWRPGAVGRERTEGAMDRGWALEDLVGRWRQQQPRGRRRRHNGHHNDQEKEKEVSHEDSSASDSEQDSNPDQEPESEPESELSEEQFATPLLSQMEATFLMILTVSNYSCLEEWKRILTLVLTCKSILKSREAFFTVFLEQLRRQLAHGDDVEGGLFDMSDDGGGYLKGLLRGFKRAVDEIFNDDDDNTANTTTNTKNHRIHTNHSNNKSKGQAQAQKPPGTTLKHALSNLETFLQSEYGWDDLGDSFLRKGMLELEDGEQVYEVEMDEMLGEDERGEYAPVVVEV